MEERRTARTTPRRGRGGSRASRTGPIACRRRPSWHDILDPKYKGRVSTVDGALNNVALGSLAVGIDPDTLTTRAAER